MSQINLIPEVRLEQNRIRKLNATLVSVAIGLGVVFGGMLLLLSIYNIGKAAQISSIKSSTNKLNDELKAYGNLEQTVITLNQGLTDMSKITAGDDYWKRFFEELEAATPGDTQFNSLNISDGTVTAEVTGKDIKSVDRFIRSFKEHKVNDKNLFDGVSVNGFSVDNNGVKFEARFSVVGGVL
jgi:hypothetical protein